MAAVRMVEKEQELASKQEALDALVSANHERQDTTDCLHSAENRVTKCFAFETQLSPAHYLILCLYFSLVLPPQPAEAKHEEQCICYVSY